MPASRNALASNARRPSSTSGRAMRSLKVAGASIAYSGHSVIRMAQSALSSAASAEAAISMLHSALKLAAACGSQPITLAPSSSSARATTTARASRTSSVSGLNARPSSATRFPFSEPSAPPEYPNALPPVRSAAESSAKSSPKSRYSRRANYNLRQGHWRGRLALYNDIEKRSCF